MKIALLEDDYWYSKNIASFLIKNGYEVDAFYDGEELINSKKLNSYSIFILDIKVPEVDGLEVLEYLKSINITTPTIYISGNRDIEYIKKAFALGCFDFIKKPFHLEELTIRIENLIQKSNIVESTYLTDEYNFNLTKKELFKDKESIKLSSKQKEILYILVKNIGNLVTYETLIDEVWGGNLVTQNTISTQIRDIKKIIGKDVIKNISKEGYKIERRKIKLNN